MRKIDDTVMVFDAVGEHIIIAGPGSDGAVVLRCSNGLLEKQIRENLRYGHPFTNAEGVQTVSSFRTIEGLMAAVLLAAPSALLVEAPHWVGDLRAEVALVTRIFTGNKVVRV